MRDLRGSHGGWQDRSRASCWSLYKTLKGNIVPVECDDGNCQSTMLSWFFQWASWMFSGIIFAFRCLVARRRTIS